ncbi:MAG: hypothetical protein KJ620_09895 [Candidatus Edwardsbacteria bacterium]|nr:hypothetical protein [Candidatus Edwardsbacteria bacterium]MBU1575654.1 hypothetical protein [Candidatus Edwardsbacteria bacterium]MBU2463015.1 hypothetical protein [Candidatus Edwardsbacteria bacterium]MBU2592943.1 hypothetical protein [Candidatus Edwardsbacteria bacterium]
MKRIVLFVLLASLGCSKTPFDRAKGNVRQYVKTMLNDPAYYKPVSWGTLDSLHFNSTDSTSVQFKRSTITGEITYSKEIREKLREIDEAGVMMGKKPEERKEAMRKFLRSKKLATPDEAKLEFELGQMATIFKIDHSFRIRGLKKQKILVKYRFYLDSTLTVTKAVDQEIRAIDSHNKKDPLGLFPEDK